MQFRQNGQRDERRRRVLRDELSTPSVALDDTTQGSSGSAADLQIPKRGYSAAVSVESQPPITCLIATRPWTLSVLLLAGLAAIAGLEAAYANVFHGSGLRPEVTLALDVMAPGSLAVWFSSLLLSMAAVNAVLVYWLRSHKLDDYRGRYRVWLWTALGLTVAAVVASTGLHRVAGYLITDHFDTEWLRNPTANGVFLLALVFGSLAIRLEFEVWASRLARVWSLVAIAGYTVAVLVRFDVIAIDGAMLTAMAESTAILVANLAVAFTVASYCRYVHLESQGALKPRRQRRSRATSSNKAEAKKKVVQPTTTASNKAATESAAAAASAKTTLRSAKINAKSIRCDSAHQSHSESRSGKTASSQPNANTTAEQAEAAPAADDDNLGDFHPETGERLSKSERRRLRKQMRRQKKAEAG